MDFEAMTLYEQWLLLALDNDKGTIRVGYSEHMLAGAMVAELLLEGRIGLDESRRHKVSLKADEPLQDELLNEALALIRERGKSRPVKHWIGKVAGFKRLYHRAAGSLCRRGVLRSSERRVLWVFSRRVYPLAEPATERQLRAAVEAAIEDTSSAMAPRMAVLVSLAYGSGLLRQLYGRKWANARRDRLEAIAAGQVVSQATQEIIQACQTAAVIAAVTPAVVAGVN